MPEIIQPTLSNCAVSPPVKTADLAGAIEELALHSGTTARGAVYTRTEVVDFILDLVDYHASKPLQNRRILEPSFGRGDFLIPIVDRLLASWSNYGGRASHAYEELGDAIRAVELHRATFSSTRQAVFDRLQIAGIPLTTAGKLVEKWLIQGDFLFLRQEGLFHYIVGNPPYVRHELIPASLLSEYRRRFSTMYDRADLYIPFIEHSLSLLHEKGTHGFICADRWMKNRYGGPLRKYISRGFHLKAYVDMVGTDAFHSDVSAYPAITVINKSKPGVTRIAHRPKVEKHILASVSTKIRSVDLPKDSAVSEMAGVVNGSNPWLLESPDQMALIRRIESQFPALEQTGCKVGIGVATGADKAFIGDFTSLDVELSRKIPLVTTKDIRSGEVIWQGQGVINPFANDGSLVDLKDYPKLARYLKNREPVIAGRHCARKAPSKWYKTIDRIRPELIPQPKLLIPDIKGEAHIVFEEGNFYPHHSLYYITSDTWDLRALQAVLLSKITKLFITTYSTKMRGGYLRFQAQYIRRIRIPTWQNVCESVRQELIYAASIRDLDACNKAASRLYKLSPKEQASLGGDGE